MRIPSIAFLLILASCTQPVSDKDLIQYVNGRQVLNLNGLSRSGKQQNDPKIEIISPDTTSVGEPFLAKIFLADRDYQLIAAYFDCEAVENPTVDTVVNTTNKSKRVDGCTKGLFVDNDTIFISFTPTAPGEKTFEEITILTRDNDKTFSTQKYTFKYSVAQK